MAKLAAVIDKPEAVDEKYRDLYTQRKDGKYVLDADGVEDVTGLRSSLEKERKNREDAEKRLKDWDGVDKEEYKRLKAEADAARKKNLKSEEEVEAYLAERTANMQKKHDADVTELKTTLSAKDQKIYDLTVENQVMAAAVKVGAHEHAMDDIKRRAKDVFKVNEKGDIVAIQPDGKAWYGDTGKPLTPEEWLNTLPSTAPHLFRGNSGGGANNDESKGGGGSNRSGAQYRSEMNTKEKTEFIKKHGQEKYQALPMHRPK